MTNPSDQDVSLRLAQRLVRQGRLDEQLAKTALGHAKHRQIRIEDALIDCGVSEHVLLRHLADLYRTQLISTEKLERAKVTARVLRMVPRSLAQRHLVVPIVLTASGELVVATPDPESVDLVKDVQLASQVREVKTTVARPAAVLAAIRKFYDGDLHAFTSLGNALPVAEGMALELTNNQGRASLTTAAISEAPPPPRPEPPGPSLRARRHPSNPQQSAARPAAATAARFTPPPPSTAPVSPSAPAVVPKGSDQSFAMAPPTAAGAARSVSDSNFASFDFNAGLSVPAPAAPTRSAAPPSVPAPAYRPNAEPSLELAISDDERARLPESGRGRVWEQREFQPANTPKDPSLPPLLGGFSDDPFEASASEDSLAPMSSTPPALGFFSSAPPAAANSLPSFNPPEPIASTPPTPHAMAAAPSSPTAFGVAAAVSAPQSMQQWMSLLDSAPPPAGTAAPSAASTTPRTQSPLSIPPAMGTLETDVPYSLSQGQGLLQAPLLFVRSIVALHERSHGDLASHSLVVAELARVLAANLGLSREDQEQVEIAALLHDLGKSRSRHLTAYAVWHYYEYEEIAREQYLLPLQLFGSSGLTPLVTAGITHLFERVDGLGFPHGFSNDAIPLLSRLLAVCDSYADLVLNANNPFGRQLSGRDALTALREKTSSVFDEALIERLATVIVDPGIDLRLRQRQVTL